MSAPSLHVLNSPHNWREMSPLRLGALYLRKGKKSYVQLSNPTGGPRENTYAKLKGDRKAISEIELLVTCHRNVKQFLLA